MNWQDVLKEDRGLLVNLSSKEKKKLTVPHIGWSALHINDVLSKSKHKLLEYINDGDEVYFIHSI